MVAVCFSETFVSAYKSIGHHNSEDQPRLVEAKWLAYRKIPGSNIGPETAYPDWGFRGVPQSPRQMPG
jgi:hypothetical protein